MRELFWEKWILVITFFQQIKLSKKSSRSLRYLLCIVDLCSWTFVIKVEKCMIVSLWWIWADGKGRGRNGQDSEEGHHARLKLIFTQLNLQMPKAWAFIHRKCVPSTGIACRIATFNELRLRFYPLRWFHKFNYPTFLHLQLSLVSVTQSSDLTSHLACPYDWFNNMHSFSIKSNDLPKAIAPT